MSFRRRVKLWRIKTGTSRAEMYEGHIQYHVQLLLQVSAYLS